MRPIAATTVIATTRTSTGSPPPAHGASRPSGRKVLSLILAIKLLHDKCSCSCLAESGALKSKPTQCRYAERRLGDPQYQQWPELGCPKRCPTTQQVYSFGRLSSPSLWGVIPQSTAHSSSYLLAQGCRIERGSDPFKEGIQLTRQTLGGCNGRLSRLAE